MPINHWRVILKPEWGIWETCRDRGIIAIGYQDSPDNIDVQRFKNRMKMGDKIIAYLRSGQIGAIGTITGNYSVDEVVLRAHFWRIRKVQWDHKSSNGFRLRLSKETRVALSQRPAIVELSKAQFEEIESQVLSR